MRIAWASALTLLLFASCSPYVQRGESLYRDGRYIEAAEVFELTEDRLAASPAEVRAQYGLYRGLTYLRLDDLESAQHWLAYASTECAREPGALPVEERMLLARGRAEIERRARSIPQRNVRFASATASARAAAPAENGQRTVIVQ